jgi:hypothetical protein
MNNNNKNDNNTYIYIYKYLYTYTDIPCIIGYLCMGQKKDSILNPQTHTHMADHV